VLEGRKVRINVLRGSRQSEERETDHSLVGFHSGRKPKPLLIIIINNRS
jgi:hypothetical protein